MERVAITGANGIIGRVIKEGLTTHKIVSLDLPDCDITNLTALKKGLVDCRAIIHLAWNWRNGFYPDNMVMTCNVYTAALELGIRRVIMASSVHADHFRDWQGPNLMTTDRIPIPNGEYGAAKLAMEALGRHHASHNRLEVACIRFGAVRVNNIPPADETHVWLDNSDLVTLITAILVAETIPNGFLLVNGVSDNDGRIHDVSNPLGWLPKKGYGKRF